MVSRLQYQVLEAAERIQRVEDFIREDTVDKAGRQLLIHGWGMETNEQRKVCTERWTRHFNIWGACEYTDALRKPGGRV
eukprot:15443078-Alexandrium_andersonii.AAC.1